MYQISPLGVVGIALQGVANGALLSLAAVYAQQIGMTIAQTALFASAPLIGGFLMQWPIGRMSDQLDRRKVLTATAVRTPSRWVTRCSPAKAFQWQFIGAGLLGGVLLPQYSLCIAHTNDRVRADDGGR